MKFFPATVLVLIPAFLATPTSLALAGKCSYNCPSSSGSCTGGTGSVEVNCSGPTCTVKITLSAAGSQNSKTETRNSGSADSITVCVPPGGYDCCMTASVNGANCTWGDVGAGKCSCLHFECVHG